ncbi:MAG: DUF1566 domain-containing protein [Candidatus Dadabacteria bacterium]|nr:DUF1566 domain-containing protein [Candidatus Dadabacteria bacterium]
MAGFDCLHCVDDEYDWFTAMSDWISEVNGHTNDSTGSTQSGLGGYTDWRMPTPAELLTIIDTSKGFCGGGNGACIDPVFGPTTAFFYQSSTTLASNSSSAWVVDFNSGSQFGDSKLSSNSNFARAVRPAHD